MSVRIVICDDDEGCCSRIEEWLYKYQGRENMDMEIAIYNSAECLLEHMREGCWFDAIFLDIELPEKTGVELGREIRNKMKNEAIYIIFISGKTKYCMDLFELEPLNFHQKPLKEEEILRDVEKVVRRSGVQKKAYSYMQDGIQKGVLLRDIMYMETMGNLIEITVQNGKKIVVRESLSRIAQKFLDCNLCQCHRSFLVNFNFVENYRNRSFIMKDGANIPVGKKYMDRAKRGWAKHGLED